MLVLFLLFFFRFFLLSWGFQWLREEEYPYGYSIEDFESISNRRKQKNKSILQFYFGYHLRRFFIFLSSAQTAMHNTRTGSSPDSLVARKHFPRNFHRRLFFSRFQQLLFTETLGVPFCFTSFRFVSLISQLSVFFFPAERRGNTGATQLVWD